MGDAFKISPSWSREVQEVREGKLPKCDDSSVGPNLEGGTDFLDVLQASAAAGSLYSSTTVVSTYSLVYTAISAYAGAVLAPNGDIHFIPRSAICGQKVTPSGTVSTYSLVYTGSNAYLGGILAPNGDIHFVPYSADRGQKISANGTVSTYSLVYTVGSAYQGGVLAPNGDIHFVPLGANRGQKITTFSAKNLSLAACLSPFLNKL